MQFDPAFLLSGLTDDAVFLDSLCLCGSEFSNIRPAVVEPDISRLAGQIVNEIENRAAGYQLAVSALLRYLLVCLHRLAPAEALSVPKRQTNFVLQLAPAMQIIARDYAGNLDIPTLARACHMSTSHFRRVFSEVFRKSPQEYLTQYRIRMGAQLLRQEGTGVLDAALAVPKRGGQVYILDRIC
ncbi:MAG: AraC family transcriptional regulator [bacterium]|nr:AraC family transcriptional regulator [bacterium]